MPRVAGRSPLTKTSIEVVIEEETPKRKKPWTFGRKETDSRRYSKDSMSESSVISSPVEPFSSPIPQTPVTLNNKPKKRIFTSTAISSVYDELPDSGFQGTGLFDDLTDVSDLTAGGDSYQTPEKKFKPTKFSTAKKSHKKKKKPIMSVKTVERNMKRKTKTWGDSSWDMAMANNVSQ